MTQNTCSGCPVQQGTHKPAGAVHRIAEPQAQHPDDAAVDRLSAAMKAKLAKQRAKGYGGWDAYCTQQRLSDMLRAHVAKGDPVDVANFCAFLIARGESIAPAAPAAQAVEPVREQFERAYATEWANSRAGDETPEQLVKEVKGWREGDSYPADMPYLKHTWDGFQWAAALRATPPAQAQCVPCGYVKTGGNAHAPAFLHAQQNPKNHPDATYAPVRYIDQGEPQAQDVQGDAGPSWMKLYYAWRNVGADLKGLSWGAFTHAVHYAPEDITAAHTEIDAAIAASAAKGGEA